LSTSGGRLALNRRLQPLAVAKYGGVELDMPEFTHMQDNKKTEYIAKFPGGKIPAFEGKDGFLLTETIAVTKYCKSLPARSLA
jgi:elongation factor 1-gamma